MESQSRLGHGVLGSDDLNPVSVLDHIVNRHQLAIDFGTYHLISHSRVNAVRKINRCGTVWQVLYISGRVKQNTVSENRSRSLFKSVINSLLSDMSRCHC